MLALRRSYAGGLEPLGLRQAEKKADCCQPAFSFQESV